MLIMVYGYIIIVLMNWIIMSYWIVRHYNELDYMSYNVFIRLIQV